MQDFSVASRGVEDLRSARDYKGRLGTPKVELVLAYREKLGVAKRYGPAIFTKPSRVIVFQVHPMVRLRAHSDHRVML